MSSPNQIFSHGNMSVEAHQQNLVHQHRQENGQQQQQQMLNHQLRNSSPMMQGMMNMGSMGMNNGAAGTNQAVMMAMMNNPTATQMGNMGGMNMNDFQRLQQLQAQLQQSTNNNANNHLANNNFNSNIVSGVSSSTGQDPPAVILQSYLDQKIQSPRFDDSLRNQLGMMGQATSGNPMNFLQERYMMNAPHAAAAGFKSMGGGTPSADLPLPSPHAMFARDGTRRMRGGVIEPFPEKLHRLLCEVTAAGRSDVISFVAGGRAFAIHKPDTFFKDIVPLYFRQSRLSSFKRQLNLYGFELINTGPARGGYYHELFVQDRPELCRRMRRVAVKVGSKGDKDKGEQGAKNITATEAISANIKNAAAAQQQATSAGEAANNV